MGLQSLLHIADMEGHIQGVAICRNGPRVSHLFFANDRVLFCQAKEEECGKIFDILATYERGSGQKINRDKTNILFSSNTSSDMQSHIQSIMGVSAIRQYEKYLGLPALVGRAKKQSFIYIKERVWKKLQGWKEKLLSQTSREVLIKVVIQAIPTYTMSCFKLPKVLIKELEVMIQKFGVVIVEVLGRPIGLNGIDFVKPRRLEGWGSKKLRSLMMLCWLSKFGG